MTTDRDGNELQEGDNIRVVRGPFSGATGTIKGIVGDQLQAYIHWDSFNGPIFIDSAYVLKVEASE